MDPAPSSFEPLAASLKRFACRLLTIGENRTGLYGVAAVCLCRRLTGRLRGWQTLSASLDQLRKDRACLEKILE